MPLQLNGLIAAPFTPFGRDGDVRLDIVERQVALLVEGGVSGAFVCGTTGEGPSLSTDERMRLAERWAVASGKSLAVVVHVGHTSLPEAKALAAHAGRNGARAISAIAPFFFKPARVADLVNFCAAVAAAAPEVPFYFYHFPGITGVSLSMVEFFEQAREKIPTFAGIKFTHNDLMEFQQCLRLAGDGRDVLFGRDEILLAGLAAGARGAIGSTYNYAAPVYRKLIAAFNAGDLAAARDHQASAVKMIEVIRKFGEMASGKAIMAMMGVDCGPPRTPVAGLSRERAAELFEELHGLGIFTRPLVLPDTRS
jgi:N-acetylneuraminate lyase